MTADLELPVGNFDVRIVRDGWDVYPPSMVFTGVPEADLAAALAGELDANGLLGLPTTGLLVRSSSRTLLLDAGYGEVGRDEGYGLLVESLGALGVAPSDVDVVVISHGHADHIAGLTLTRNGRQVPVFPRASHVFWADEWRFWTTAESLDGLPRDLAEPARASLPPLADADLVRLLDRETEIVPGIRVIPLPGHTPGHVAVEIQDADQSLLYVGDALFHPLSLRRPEWTCVFDSQPEAAVASRRRVLERAARRRSVVVGSHLPSPGRVQSAEDGFRLVAV